LDVSDRPQKHPAVVALGGGHGLSVTLRSLASISHQVTGLVGTVDDGGSSGRLRQHLHIPPPGDLRMAVAALMPDDEQGTQWRAVLQHRFDGEVDVGGHALGNLVLAALWEETGDVVAGLTILSEAMRTRGRVLPNCLTATDLIAQVRTAEGVVEMRGQSAISQTRGFIEQMRLDPVDPTTCSPAVRALEGADLIVFGPGSWYTSVLPHLLVPSIRQAIEASSAHRVVIVNLTGEAGETEGYPAHEYLSAWARLFPDVGIDTVLADRDHVDDLEQLRVEARRLGAQVRICRVSGGLEHDPDLLADALGQVIGSTDGVAERE
jgi:uncharacterized cofD-like protein